MRFVPVLLFCALMLAACSDAFDPFVESDRTFALYGFLDARQDTQYVRVQAITEQEEPGSTVAARVTSTDLVTEETIAWQDSLVRLDDGELGTAFFAVFRPEAGRMYRIEATRPDDPGAASEVVVMLPAEPPLQTAEPEVIGGAVAQRLTLPGDLRPENVRVAYTVQRVEVGSDPIGFSFERNAQPVVGGGAFDVLVPLSRDAQVIRSTLGIDPQDPEPVALLSLQLSYEIVDEQRAEVTGGIGNVGAAAAFETEWTLAEVFVEAIGFVDAQGSEQSPPAAQRAMRYHPSLAR